MRTSPAFHTRGFTLIELLAVTSIIGVLAYLTVPSLASLQTSSGFASAVSRLDDLLQQSRSYAMGQNRYVYVGLAEVDAAQRSPGPTQTAEAGIGRLVVGIIYAADGSRGYDANAANTPVWTAYGDGAGFSALTQLQVFENTHIVDLGASPSTGEMARPAVSDSYRLGNNACVSATPFEWPLGRPLNGGQYHFTAVIQFDPRGTARVVFPTSGSAIPQAIEIGLQPTHGNVIPVTTSTTSSPGNMAAIQINGVTGSTRVYRP